MFRQALCASLHPQFHKRGNTVQPPHKQAYLFSSPCTEHVEAQMGTSVPKGPTICPKNSVRQSPRNTLDAYTATFRRKLIRRCPKEPPQSLIFRPWSTTLATLARMNTPARPATANVPLRIADRSPMGSLAPQPQQGQSQGQPILKCGAPLLQLGARNHKIVLKHMSKRTQIQRVQELSVMLCLRCWPSLPRRVSNVHDKTGRHASRSPGNVNVSG